MIGVVALARETFDVAYAESVAAKAFGVLDGVAPGFAGERRLLFDADSTRRAIRELETQAIDTLVVLQVSFTDAAMTGELAAAFDVPLIFWAFPEDRTGGRLRLNALCGMNLAAHTLGRTSRPFSYLYMGADNPGAPAELQRLLTGGTNPYQATRIVPDAADLSPGALRTAERVEEALDGMRTGVVGDYPDGFDPCRYDPEALRRLTGVSAERIELGDLFSAADGVSGDRVESARDRAVGSLGPLDDLDQASLEKSLRLYGGLRDLAGEREWAGVATRCWPECFTEYGGSACAPQAMLTDDGIPGMCEADVYGNVTSLILLELAGDAPFVADLVDVDFAGDTAVFWHCGLAPISMANPDAEALPTVHSNRRKPLLHEFPLKPGRVTIARLSQAGDSHKLVVGGGDMLAAPLPFSGTAGTLRFDKPVAEVLATIMGEGLEHHYGLVYGEYEEDLLALAARWGLPVVNLT